MGPRPLADKGCRGLLCGPRPGKACRSKPPTPARGATLRAAPSAAAL